METKDGKSYKIRTLQTASYAQDAIPTDKSGSIAGIAGIYNGTLQILPCNGDDIQLAEARFTVQGNKATLAEVLEAGAGSAFEVEGRERHRRQRAGSTLPAGRCTHLRIQGRSPRPGRRRRGHRVGQNRVAQRSAAVRKGLQFHQDRPSGYHPAAACGILGNGNRSLHEKPRGEIRDLQRVLYSYRAATSTSRSTALRYRAAWIT